MITLEPKPLITKHPVLLNCGSGQRPFGENWLNIDIQERWKPDIVADCSNLSMFPDSSVDMVVAHHQLEHAGVTEANQMLREWHRILKPGKSLLVFVPDMWELAAMWREGRLTDETYMIDVYGAFMSDEADRHRYGYTPDLLAKTLRNAGFRYVFSFDWRHIPGADFGRDRWILSQEAIK